MTKSFLKQNIPGTKRTYAVTSNKFTALGSAAITGLNTPGVGNGVAIITGPGPYQGKQARRLSVMAPDGQQANGIAYTMLDATMGLPPSATVSNGALIITAAVDSVNADGSVNMRVTATNVNAVQLYVSNKLITQQDYKGSPINFTINTQGNNNVGFQGWNGNNSVLVNVQVSVNVPILPDIKSGTIRGSFLADKMPQAFEFLLELQMNGWNAPVSGQIRPTTFHEWKDETTEWVDVGIDTGFVPGQWNTFELHASFDMANRKYYYEWLYINDVPVFIDRHVGYNYTPAVMPNREPKNGTGIYVAVQQDWVGAVWVADLEIDIYS